MYCYLHLGQPSMPGSQGVQRRTRTVTVSAQVLFAAYEDAHAVDTVCMTAMTAACKGVSTCTIQSRLPAVQCCLRGATKDRSLNCRNLQRCEHQQDTSTKHLVKRASCQDTIQSTHIQSRKLCPLTLGCATKQRVMHTLQIWWR